MSDTQYHLMEKVEVEIVTERTGGANDSGATPPGVVTSKRTLWHYHGPIKANNQDQAVRAFIGDEETEGRTFMAIPDRNYDEITFTQVPTPKTTLTHARPRSRRSRSTTAAS